MIYTGNRGRRINSQRKIRGRPKAGIGLIILIILAIVFFIRVIGVLKDNKERGAFVYVQLLNIGLPVVENEVYDEGTYAENKLSISNVCFEALGIKDITYEKILSNELAILGSLNKDNYVYENKSKEIAKTYFSNVDYSTTIKFFIRDTIHDIARELSGDKLSLEKFDSENEKINNMIDKKIDDFVINFKVHNN